MDEITNNNEPIKFPCPVNGYYTTFKRCDICGKKNTCDIYLMMLDEDFD